MTDKISDDTKAQAIAAELREYGLGNLDVEHDDLSRIVGLIPDEEVRDMLLFQNRVYEPVDDMPRNFWETDYAEEIIEKQATHMATRAVQNNNISEMEFLTGLVGYESDVSGMKALLSLQQLIRDAPVFIAYIFAAMGFGKTDFSLLICEVFEAVYDKVKFGANIESWDEADAHIESFTELEEWFRGNKEDDYDRVFVLDEASQNLTGKGGDIKNQEALAKMLRLTRKYDGHLIIIGHDGKDVGPAVRTLATTIVEKKSQKEAVFWRDVQDRQGRGEIMSLSGIPPTDMEYDTEEETDWEMDIGEDEDVWTEEDVDDLLYEEDRKKMALLDLHADDLQQKEIAEWFDVTSKTVRRARKQYEDEFANLSAGDADAAA